ncbi:hypothetical protein RYH80_12890 [Halobaculum sp. MBLA0147]|uniref:hypothetical protein n=1 Tax=Halobaculum sp. MBLA0147 TaxID=3079934 RepID=UPI0035259E32
MTTNTDHYDFDLGPRATERQQSFLDTLLAACDGEVSGRTKFMKLVFMLEHFDPATRRLVSEPRFGVFDDFHIYDYGPFSGDVMDAFDELKSDGVVSESDEYVDGRRGKVIERNGEVNVEPEFETDDFEEIVDQFGDETGSTLADRSLELLGIDPSEKERYRHTDVSEIVA